jgi:hypothetical protein
MSTSKQCKVLIKKDRDLTTTRSSKLPSESPDSIDAITTVLKFCQRCTLTGVGATFHKEELFGVLLTSKNMMGLGVRETAVSVR